MVTGLPPSERMVATMVAEVEVMAETESVPVSWNAARGLVVNDFWML
jgi:hypothetical protein